MQNRENLLENTIDLAKQAGSVVMEIYNSGDFDVTTKNENGYISPLTRADTAANQVIEEGLKQFSNYPIMSEEGSHEISSGTFWCVDPIDGTKEFVAKNGEFTVNIGLVKEGRPVLGVVLAPAQGILYYGSEGAGAFKQTKGENPVKIEARFSGETPVVAVSRSHLNEETEEFLAKLGNHELIKTGSSIKFCLVADGAAAIYPRLGESHLWDTAAADAVVRAAGGQIIATTTRRPLDYNPAELINPNFIVAAANIPTDQF